MKHARAVGIQKVQALLELEEIQRCILETVLLEIHGLPHNRSKGKLISLRGSKFSECHSKWTENE